MVTKKKKIPKTDPKKLMALVVDESLLENRKKNENKDSKREDKQSKEEPKTVYNKWDNIQKSDFIKKEVDGNFYGQHKEWKKNIWIGPYRTEKELDKVINSYVTETKKDILHRDIKNIHSVLMGIE